MTATSNDGRWQYVKGQGWVEVEAPAPAPAPAVDDPDLVAVLPNYRRWLHRTVHQMNSDPNAHDDLVQEAYIAMWRALRTYDPSKGALPSWLNRAAYRRLVDLLNGKPITGREGAGQGVPRAARDGQPAVSVQQLADVGWDLADLDAGDAFDLLLVGYHEGEIAAAVDRLTPKQREYVRLRFWEGLGQKGLTEVFGYDPTGIWRTARRNLAADLEHLRDLASV